MVRNIQIKPVLNGFIVDVGCQTVVIKTVAELSQQIAAYYTDPKTVEQLYIKSCVNRTMDGPTAVEMPHGLAGSQCCESPAPTCAPDEPRMERRR